MCLSSTMVTSRVPRKLPAWRYVTSKSCERAASIRNGVATDRPSSIRSHVGTTALQTNPPRPSGMQLNPLQQSPLVAHFCPEPKHPLLFPPAPVLAPVPELDPAPE